MTQDRHHWDDYGRGRQLAANAIAAIGPALYDRPDIRTSVGPIDHLVVGPTRLWVIGVTALDLPLSVRDAQLFRGDENVHAVIRSLHRRAAVVDAQLDTAATPLLIVPGELDPTTPDLVDGVRVVHLDDLADVLTDANNAKTAPLSDDARARLIGRIDAWADEIDALASRARPIATPSGALATSRPQPATSRRRSMISTIAAIVLAASTIGAAVWVLSSEQRRTTVADWLESPFGDDDASAAPSVVDLAPLRAEFVCDSSTSQTRLRLHVVDPGALNTQLAVTSGGAQRYLGVFAPGSAIDDTVDVTPGSDVVVVASWDGDTTLAAGSVRRTLTVPSDICP